MYSSKKLTELTLLCVVAWVASVAGAAADPPLELTDDMLNGRWVLNQASDLLVANPVRRGESSNFIQMKVLQYNTDGNYVSGGGSEYNIGAELNPQGSPYPLPQQTRAARLFDQPSDTVVTIGAARDRASSLAVYFGGARVFNFSTNTDVNKLQMAVGDLTGDGYDDLVVMNDQTMWVLTAADVEHPVPA